MKNLTLSIDENVLKEIRRYAADRGTTVNAIVRDHLTRIATQEDKAANARRELVELAKTSSWDPGPGWKWSREEIYDRPVFSRFEHPDLRSDDKGTRTKKSGDRRRARPTG